MLNSKSRKLDLATVAFFGMVAVASAQSPKWKHVQGGLINDVAFATDEIGCTVEDGGRIRYTDDGGQTWEYANVPDGIRKELFAVSFLRGSDEVVYACGDGGIILKSLNSGVDWSDANGSSRILDALDQPAKLQDIFMFSSGATDASGFVVGYDGAIAFTTDNWVTWSRPDSDTSTDLPFWYTDAEEDPLDIYDIHFFYDENLTGNEYHYQYGIFCGDLKKVYLTSDGGDSWNTVGSMPSGGEICPDNHYVELWMMSFLDPDDPASSGFAGGGHDTVNGYLFKTGNGGSSWTQTYCYDMLQPNQIPFEGCGIPTIYDVEVIGSSSPLAVASGYGQAVMLAKTTGTPDYNPCLCEAGNPCNSPAEVWHQLNADAQKVNPSPLTADPAIFGSAQIDAGNACFVGQFGRILTLDYDGGSGGTPLFVDRASIWPHRLRDAYFIAEGYHSKGFATGQGWTLWHTTDFGVNWTLANLDWTHDESNYIMGIDLRPEAGVGACVGTGGFVAKGTVSNYVWSWEKLEAPGEIPSNLGDLQAVAFAAGSDDVAYAVGNAGRVIKSDDGGATWTRSTSAGSDLLHGVSFVDEDKGLVCGALGKIYKTTNGGANWSAVSVSGDPTITFYDVAAWSASGGDGIAAIAVGQGGAVYKKDATDTSFAAVSHGTGATSDLFDVEVLSAGQYIRTVGANGTYLYSDNYHSGSWDSKKSSTSHPLFKVSCQSSAHGYAVGGSFVVLRYH